MGMAGIFRNYHGSGLAGEINCKVVDSGTLIGIGIYGGRVSIIVHTMYCYWKIVIPIHHRKHYRRWMVYVGIILPWLVGAAVKMALALATTGIVDGACRPRAYVQSVSAFKVYAVLVCTFCTLYCIGSRPSDHYFRSVCLSVCLFVQFFSAVFDPISIKLGHFICLDLVVPLEYRGCATPGGWVTPKTCTFRGLGAQNYLVLQF